MLDGDVKVYLALGATDLRKSINGLAVLVSEHLEQDALSGNYFVFCNRTRSLLKLLYWDRNGFCLWMKRLEQDKFRWPSSEKEVLCISRRQLNWLLEGLSLDQKEAHSRLNYRYLV